MLKQDWKKYNIRKKDKLILMLKTTKSSIKLTFYMIKIFVIAIYVVINKEMW